jgi:F0F1-type ATP synthase membrane subunit b/b'
MKEQPTPETDYMKLSNDCNALGFWLMTQHARKLERERDEARGDLEFWRGLYKNLEKIIEEAKGERDEWAAMCGRYKQERDEALMDRANGDIATMTINHYERILRERDEAREQVQQMSDSNQVLMADVRFYRNAWEQLKEQTK